VAEKNDQNQTSRGPGPNQTQDFPDREQDHRDESDRQIPKWEGPIRSEDEDNPIDIPQGGETNRQRVPQEERRRPIEDKHAGQSE
jgi:hypothetical protein